MKKVLFIALAVMAFGITSMTINETEKLATLDAMQTHVKIKIVNDCSSEVKYEYNGLHGTLSKNYYRYLTIKPGFTLIIDGKDFTEITTSSDKKEFTVCR